LPSTHGLAAFCRDAEAVGPGMVAGVAAQPPPIRSHLATLV